MHIRVIKLLEAAQGAITHNKFICFLARQNVLMLRWLDRLSQNKKESLTEIGKTYYNQLLWSRANDPQISSLHCRYNTGTQFLFNYSKSACRNFELKKFLMQFMGMIRSLLDVPLVIKKSKSLPKKTMTLWVQSRQNMQ